MKKNRQFTQTIGGFVILLTLAGSLVYFFGKNTELALPVLELDKSAKIAMTASVGIQFPREMDTQSVETRMTTNPDIPLKLNWIGKKLVLTPETAFPPGKEIAINIKAGARSSDGRVYTDDIHLLLNIRQPRVIFIGQATTAPEVWLFDPESDSIQAVTATAGKITGYFPYPDGSSILFTRRNDQGGADVYLVNSDRMTERLLENCGPDTCRDAVVDPFSNKIAYARNRKPGSTETSRDFYIYILDLHSGQTSALYPGGEIRGVAPSWSPDGSKIAFYDQNSLGIRIKNENGSNDFLLGSRIEQSGCWSPDGTRFMFTDEIVDNGFAYSQLYAVDLQSSSITQPLGSQYGLEEFGMPAWSPDGKSIVMGVRQNNAGVSKQLWLFDLDKKTRSAITSGYAYSNAVPQWRPDGEAIVFQQAQLGSSGVKPAIIVWNRSDNTFETVASDGALPAWLP